MTPRWLPDAVAGALVLLAALIEIVFRFRFVDAYQPSAAVTVTLIALATAVAVGLARPAPAAALLLGWGTILTQAGVAVLDSGPAPLLLVQITLTGVLFGAACWGRTATVWFAALSIPAGGAVLALFLASEVASALSGVADIERLLDVSRSFGGHWRVGAAIIGMLALGVPWLLGLLVRISASARTDAAVAATEIAQARTAREHASELARLRAEQARLARDVHDVVGHSLAVILAQAESAQYLPDSDPAALKSTLATVATSARTSLREIREVLAATGDGGGDLDGLIEGLRTGGREVVSTQSGIPVPLAPEVAETAFRVLQEMLTNAIRHGRRDSAIIVRRDWPPETPELVLEVRNGTEIGPPEAPGRGLTGMRQRLQAVGGRLTFERRGDVFAVQATFPGVRR